MPASDRPSFEASQDARANTQQAAQKNFSCVLCSQRKVRCDRSPNGCTNCAKGRVPCIYKAPPPPRRRKKGVRDVDTTTRLRIYENALREFGVDPEELVKQESSIASVEREISNNNDLSERSEPGMKKKVSTTEVGVLISEKGKSRYLENGIWTSLRSEFRDTKEILEESSDDEESPERHDTPEYDSFAPKGGSLVFGSQVTSVPLHMLHPEPVQIFKLWQTYLDNINPLVKVFHAPTVQQLVLSASSDVGMTSHSMDALLFAIYCITVESLDDGKCLAMLGQSKATALQRFRHGAQRALINANLLRTCDMMVLQAFVLFIMSFQNFDARVIWVWSGIAQRIGQRIGLHRDGAKLGLPPFEVELRRRLWWQIVMLEGYSQKLSGTGSAGSILKGDVTMPSNVNDSDLFIGMKEPPKEHDGATEMMFYLIRCHVGDFLNRSAVTHTTFDGVWHRLTSSALHVAMKEKAIGELETLFQQKFLQYCVASIPWHFLCSQLAQTVISMMRFMAHSTEYSSGKLSQSEQDTLFQLALKVVAAQNLAYTMKEMHGFMWHVNLHFQWKAFVYTLSELRYRTQGAEVDQAWIEVETAYAHHPSFDAAPAKRALPIAVNNLTLKAWEAHVMAHGARQGGEPDFIRTIRQQRDRTNLPPKLAQQFVHSLLGPAAHRVPNWDMTGGENMQSASWEATADFSALSNFPDGTADPVLLAYPDSVDWEAWDNLMNGGEGTTIDLSAFDLELQLN